MEGWIKLHRQLQDNPLWLSEQFTRGQAWIDLLLLANHEYGFFYLREHKIEVNRGEVGWSELKLSLRWKWSRTKTRKFLNDLEKEQQIKVATSHSTTIITIINYDKYQQKEQQDGQQENNSKTIERQQQDTNNNDKKNKNDNNKEINNQSKSLKPTIEQIKSYCIERKNTVNPNQFFDFYESKGWVVGKTQMKDWKASVRTWERNSNNNQPQQSQSRMAFEQNIPPI